MAESVEIVRSDANTGPTYHFSNYKQLLKALEANGYNEKWGAKDVPETFSQITLSEQELKDLVKRLNQAQTCFEQQNLLRIITMNKLKSELGSITFRNTEELKTAIEQRGVDYPKKYLHQSAESEIIKGFSAHRTLSTSQWEKLITDLKGVNESDPMLDQKRGEIIIAAFGISTGTPRAGTAGLEAATPGPQKVLVDEFYPSREEATKDAFKGATSFPITVKYSEGGKSYEYQVTTTGNKMIFGGKEISFTHKAGSVAKISLVENMIVFFDASNKQVFAIDKRTFGSEISGELLKRNNPKLELFGDIKLQVAGSVSAKNIPTPQVEKELTGEELRQYIFTLAKKELEGITSTAEKMTPEELEQKIQSATALLDFKWLEKIPGMKDKVKEIMKFDVTMEGVIGAGFVGMLEKQGYKMRFVGKNKVEVGHASGSTDAKDVESKVNMHLSNNPRFVRMVQTGMLYRQPSFEMYRQNVTDADGKLINPEKTTISNYTEYLMKRRKSLNPTEALFLQSARYFDKDISFASIVTQGKDYQAVVGFMQSMTDDEDLRGLLGTPERGPNGTGGSRATEPPAPPASGNERGGSGGPAGTAGQALGKIGGLIGKLGEAGIGGGMRVLGEIFQEANKAGGAYGTLAVIGLIGYSIFGKKGLGFWGTIGAILGLGVADTAARGGFKGMFSGGNTPGGNPAGEPPAPNAAAAAVAPPAPSVGTGPANQPGETPQAKPLTESSFIARAVGRENIYDTDVENERSIINATKKMNFLKLQTALSKGDKPSWKAAVDSAGFKSGSAEYKALAQAIHAKNEFGRNTLASVMNHISINEHMKSLDPANSAGLSLEQAIEYIIKKENEKKQEDAQGTFEVEQPAGSPPIPPGHPGVRDILNKNEAYGNLVILARMVENGYLPKINFTAGEVLGGTGFVQRFVRGFVWVGLGGPLTNNTPGANWFSGKYRVHEEAFYSAVKNLVDEEKAVIKKETPSLPNEAVFQGLRDEVTARNAALLELEEALSSKDPARIKSALAKYREVAKTPFYKGRIDKEKFALSERQSITAIETVNARIQEEYNTWKQAQDIANSETATPEQKKTALEASNKYNQSVMELEAHGIKNLQLLSPEAREVVMKENPWAARVAQANGGLAKMNEKLGKVGSHWAGKTILGVGLIGLLWENKGGVAELWNKGDYVTLSKLGWDLVAGAVPVVSSVHETAMLSNAGGYRDFILGKGYEMGTLEKGFRVAGAIPLGVSLTTVGGKLAVRAGARGVGQAVIGVSEIVGSSVKTIGTVGTFGFLGYQAVHVAYNIPMHLIDNK